MFYLSLTSLIDWIPKSVPIYILDINIINTIRGADRPKTVAADCLII
jgi:hypothetical protein